MNLGCLVDVSGRLDDSELERLVQAAYDASKCHPVILLVRPSVRGRVDRVLAASAENGRGDTSGVLFKDPDTDLDRILSAARLVSLVIATDTGFRALLARRRIPHHSPATGIEILKGVDRDRVRTA